MEECEFQARSKGRVREGKGEEEREQEGRRKETERKLLHLPPAVLTVNCMWLRSRLSVMTLMRKIIVLRGHYEKCNDRNPRPRKIPHERKAWSLLINNWKMTTL